MGGWNVLCRHFPSPPPCLRTFGMACLTIVGRDDSDSRFDLIDGETTLGRHPDCTIVVDAGAVSRFHAKIVNRTGVFLLEDSGSRNGTFLNGQMLTQPTALKNNDILRVSDVEFVFATEEESSFNPSENEMTFDGAHFGIQMIDDQDTESLRQASKVEFSNSPEGLKMTATPEAKLEALMNINRKLTGALAVDEVLPKVLESLFSIFPAADRGFVVLEDADGNLVPRWVKTRNPQEEAETVRISRTIIRQVMNAKEPILSFDASDDSRFDSAQSIADFSIRSMICAPLLDADGNSIGALQVDSTAGRGQFRDEDADLLAGVAAQSGVVIRNAKLHEQAMHQKEVEQDLKLATEVQQAFLPTKEPDIPGFRIASHYDAAHHIGGDYYDYIHLPDGRVAVVVADVVGHGVAAAMFMAKLSAETRFCLASIPDLSKAIETLNDNMSELQVERFITFLLVVIDPKLDHLSIVNAGHMAPLVRLGTDGSIYEPGEEESGLPIAIDTGMEYEQVDFSFAIGDVAVLYTDGINEAMDIQDEEFGIEDLRRLTAQGGTADEIKDRIVQDVLKFVGDRPPFDDMCMVVIERVSDENQNKKTVRIVDTVDGEEVENALRKTTPNDGGPFEASS